MTTRHLTLRVDTDAFDRLDAESKRTKQTRSELAKRLLEEGLRMEAHPGIVFRSGTSGRRPALANGPQVWVVARVFRDMKGSFDDAVAKTAEITEMAPQQARIAARYYAEYRDEIDGWIAELDEYAEKAYATWLREQNLLRE